MIKVPKIALAYDWLTEVGGAEKVLLSLHELFPDAPIYTSQYRAKTAPAEFRDADVRTGWLNVFPRGLRKFLSPLRYRYFSRLKLREYDVIISINNAEAKNISRKNLKKNALHISYMQGPPTQYYWGLYDQYIDNPGFGRLNFLARFGLKMLVKPLRNVDHKAAQRPDVLLANSTYVQQEIKKYYHRDSTILFPPVSVKNLQKVAETITSGDVKNVRKRLFNGEEFYMISGRQVGWKRIDLAIDACIKLKKNLLVIGYGAEHNKLVERARNYKNIVFLPRYNGATDIAKYFVSAKAFLFPSLEPFGVAPIEALACGCPVVAFQKGGSLDFIKEGQNGVFFKNQTSDSLAKGLEKIESMKLDKKTIAESATKFDEENFQKNAMKLIENYYAKHKK
jgi:glycosyltransferase involved in cell wall biosynthesis